MKKRFVILDGSSLMYRAFYALPLLTAPTGEYTNAIYGFSNMLTKLMRDLSPDLLVIAFDKGKKTFRNDLFADYKGTRKPTPVELSAQIPLLHDFAAAWGIALVELAGFEADDVIGTLANKAVAEGYESFVVTGDRDALQLVQPYLKVLLTKKGISDMAVYDEAAFLSEYGFAPKTLIDLKGLMGDTSDNIPGVPGVGQKTATKLLLEYGNVENVLEHIEDVSGKKLKERLQENREQALLSKRLATIDCQIPVDFQAESYKIQPDRARLLEFCHRYEMKSVLKGLDQLLKEDTAMEPLLAEDAVQAVLPEYQDMKESGSWDAFEKQARACGGFSMAGRYSGRVPELKLEGAAFCAGNRILFATADEMTVFAPLLADKNLQKTVCGLKDLYHAGILPEGKVLDLELAAYLLEPAVAAYTAEDLFTRYIPQENQPTDLEDVVQQSVWESFAMMKLAPILQQKLAEYSLDKLYREIELPLVAVLAAMEQNGVYVNRTHLREKALEVGERIGELQQDIYELAKGKFNINSPKQLGEILFDRLDLPPVKKTKTGYSTNAEVLESLRFQHPIVERILSYRLWNKLKSTYLDSIDGLISPVTQRVHTSFNQLVTATGRLSSSDPNLQNIPVRTEEGKQIRTLFEPGKGYDYLLSADYSQIELRLLAHLSQDKNFVEAFTHGQDIHARTAAEVFGVPLDAVTDELRRRAKAVNFGIVYGISDYGLSRDLHIPRKEAAGYIESYFAKCSGVKKFIDQVVEEAHKNGYVTTMFGRRRDLPAIHSSNYNQRTLAERMAMNTPIQGSAADIIKLAMIAAYRKLKEAQVRSRILLQVHDELVLEVPADEVSLVSDILKDAMENVVALSVPLSVDVHIGKNWAEAK